MLQINQIFWYQFLQRKSFYKKQKKKFLGIPDRTKIFPSFPKLQLHCYLSLHIRMHVDYTNYNTIDDKSFISPTDSMLYYPINNQCSLSFKNQSIDLQCKSIDWFLYDGEHWSLMGKVLLLELIVEHGAAMKLKPKK